MSRVGPDPHPFFMQDIDIPEGHGPKEWTVVVQQPLIVSAMCICGDDDCYFTAIPPSAVAPRLHVTGNVKLPYRPKD